MLLALLFELLYAPDILQRIFLLFLSLASLALFAWMIWTRPSAHLYRKKSVLNLVRNIEIGFMVLLVIAVVANLVGAFSLAQFLTLIPIQIAFLVLVVKVVTRFTDLALVYSACQQFFTQGACSERFF